jgi:oligopeptide transport system substrate-binding protein
VLAGCGGPPPALVRGPVPDPSTDDRVVVWLGPVEDLHPHRTDAHLAAAITAPLVHSNPVTRLPVWGPQAPASPVESLTSSDLQRWELVLKPGWRWHDGRPLVAADLERGWRAALQADLPLARAVVDVRATGPRTLAFALDAPFAQVPHLLTAPAFVPLPPAAASDPAAYAAAPVGTGPYRVAGRTGDRLHLALAASHPLADRAGLAAVDVDLGPAPDRAADLVVGADGEVRPPAGAGDAARTQLVRLPGRQVAFLGFPTTAPPYADASVRLALSLAVDRTALAALLGGAVVPADRLVGPGLARAGGVTCAACQHDPERARALWADAAPATSPVLVFAEGAGHEPVVEAVAAQWRAALGVDVDVVALPAATLLARLADADVDGAFRLSWAADVAAPVRVLEPLFGPRGAANDTRFRSERVGELLAAAGGERDLLRALDAYAAVEQAVLDLVPVAPLWTSTVPIAATPAVRGVVLDGEGRLDLLALGT